MQDFNLSKQDFCRYLSYVSFLRLDEMDGRYLGARYDKAFMEDQEINITTQNDIFHVSTIKCVGYTWHIIFEVQIKMILTAYQVKNIMYTKKIKWTM